MSDSKSSNGPVFLAVGVAVLAGVFAIGAAIKNAGTGGEAGASTIKPGEFKTTEINGNVDVDLGRAPDFALENFDGRTIRTQDLAGKAWAVCFIFTTCGGPCPAMTEVMKLIQENTSDIPNFRLVTITVDPDRDVPAALKEYAKEHGADTSRWYFLRGTKDATRLVENVGFKLGNPNNLLEHDERITLVRPDGRIFGYYLAAGPNRAAAWRALVEDAKKIARETK